MKKWYFSDNGKVSGPLSIQDAEAFVSKNENLYGWQPAFSQWLPVHLIPEFSEIAAPPKSGQQIPQDLIDDYLAKKKVIEEKIKFIDETVEKTAKSMQGFAAEIDVYQDLTKNLSDEVKGTIVDLEKQHEKLEKKLHELKEVADVARAEAIENIEAFENRLKEKEVDLTNISTAPISKSSATIVKRKPVQTAQPAAIAEAPKAEAPKVEAAKVEAPKAETPKAEAPKVDIKPSDKEDKSSGKIELTPKEKPAPTGGPKVVRRKIDTRVTSIDTRVTAAPNIPAVESKEKPEAQKTEKDVVKKVDFAENSKQENKETPPAKDEKEVAFGNQEQFKAFDKPAKEIEEDKKAKKSSESSGFSGMKSMFKSVFKQDEEEIQDLSAIVGGGSDPKKSEPLDQAEDIEEIEIDEDFDEAANLGETDGLKLAVGDDANKKKRRRRSRR